MNDIYIFFTALFLLFFLSRALTQALSAFLFEVTRNESVTLYILSFIFLPGVFVHEMSHYISAVILRVSAGGMEFIPKKEGNVIKMGSVKIANTDPFRRLLIGVSPIIFGTVIIFFVLSFFVTNGLNSNIWTLLLVGYLIFVIGNTMYSSRRDLEGAVYFFILILFTLIIFYFSGLSLPDIQLSFVNDVYIKDIFSTASKFLLVPIGIDIFFLLLFRILRYFFML